MIDAGEATTAAIPELRGLRRGRPMPEYGASAWLAKQALLTPQREALVEGATRRTYRQLDQRVTRLARALHAKLGIRRFDRVATLTLNAIEFVELFYATARLGALLVPLNVRLAPRELAYQLRDSGARALFVGPELAELAAVLPAGLPVERRIAIGDEYEALLAAASGDRTGSTAESADALDAVLPARFEDPHLILYTSGTTGHPKGAVLTHANWFWNAVNVASGVELSGRDTTVTVLPLFHSGGIGLFTVPTLGVGGRVAILRRFEAAALASLIQQERATLVFGVPAIWQAMLELPEFTVEGFPSLRYLSSGGAPCPLSVIEGLHARGFTLLQGYGLTETAPGGTLLAPEDAHRKAGTVGKPFPYVELRVVDAHDRDTAPNEIGEILFRGPNVFAGYWNLPEATAAAFTPDGWFRTGDLGRLDAEGFLTVVDRKKDMIISGGENVYSAEVEDVLHAHPAVAEAAVIGVPDPRWGEAVRAIVVVRAGVATDEATLIAHCREHLARYKVPRSVVFTDALPRNATGKVLKRDLREQFGAP